MPASEKIRRKRKSEKKVCRVDGSEIGAAAVGVKWRALIWAAPWKKIKEKKLFAPTTLSSYLSARQDDLGKKKRKRRRRENGKSKYLSRSIGRKTTFMSCQRRSGCLLLYSLLPLLLPPLYTQDTPESETKIISKNLLVNTNNSKYLTFYFSFLPTTIKKRATSPWQTDEMSLMAERVLRS